MPSTRTMGINVTDVDTEAKMPLGFEFHAPADGNDGGPKVWIYVYNDSGSNIVANRAVMRKAGVATYNVLEATAAISPQRIAGISQHAIANSSYGFVLKRGHGTVEGDALVTPDLGMIMDGGTAGMVTHAAAATGAAFGCTNVGKGGSGTFTAFIDCRG